MKLNVILFSCLLWASFSAQSQDPVRTIGRVKQASIHGNRIAIRGERAFADITVYSANVIRVRISAQPLRPDLSYAVVATPAAVSSHITQTSQEITVVTDSLKMLISKTPFAISYFTPGGQLINGEEPGLYTSWVGEEVTSYRHMQEGERFIGLGEKTGDLDRRGSGYTNWNTDAYGYSAGQDPIYSSVPFYIGIHHNMNYGIFLDNTFQTDFNFGASNDRFASFGARGGEMNYYFIYHTRMRDILRSYTWLTGRMPLPPLWSLGYQQNRYSYYPDTEVLRIAQTLREKKIPADGITLDIHYMDRYQLFTWDKQRFPDPVSMTNKLKAIGFKTTVIVDPGIKVEPGAAAFERGLQQDAYIKYPDGKYYTGQVWPGWCHFTDFTSEKGRRFWRKEISFFHDNGISGIWNDMNEIATWGQKMPSNVLFDFEGRKGTLLEAHNVYGSLMARTSYEGARLANPGERPFVLTRAGYAGMQRYTAIWTGDNRSEDNHMLAGVRLLSSLGLSGVPFTGMDIGGFTGNPSQALYARWMQLGAFFPYFRNHTGYNNKSAEPWTMGEDVTNIARNYISLRYRLLPYLYSSFYEATQDGLPVVRSLAIDHAFDNHIYQPAFQNQFLFGPSMMVIPAESGKEYVKAYFPAGKWYDLYTDKTQPGASEAVLELNMWKLPVYVQESAIIPMQSLVQSTAEQPGDMLSIHLYKGSVSNSYTYYEDDGKTYEYEKGNYYQRVIEYDPASNSIHFSAKEGAAASKFKTIQLYLHGFEGATQLVINGTSLALSAQRISMLNDGNSLQVLQAVFRNDAAAMKIDLK